MSDETTINSAPEATAGTEPSIASSYEMPETPWSQIDEPAPSDGDASVEGEGGSLEPEAPSSNEPSQEQQPETIEIDGQIFNKSDVLAAWQDHQNKEQWQRENTQKAQEVAEQRRQLEEALAQVEALKQQSTTPDINLSPEEQQSLRLLEEQGLIVSQQKAQELAQKAVEEALRPFQQEQQQRQEEQAIQQLKSEFTEFIEKRQLTPQEGAAVQQFMIDKGYTALSFDDAYMVMNKDKFQDPAIMRDAIKEEVEADKQRQQAAGQSVKSSGASTPGSNWQYDPETDSGKSLKQIVAEKIKGKVQLSL